MAAPVDKYADWNEIMLELRGTIGYVEFYSRCHNKFSYQAQLISIAMLKSNLKIIHSRILFDVAWQLKWELLSCEARTVIPSRAT